ncbi:MAG: cysteine desulfurase [Alphaproteobacteria bacterium]|nr:cysteine desulfurase [Alphaproteobacteria bacterium]MBL6953379.1 cysteine desulfurase [Alphaproteobacteria bacterium]
MDKTVYIDHNATTPPLPEVIDAVCGAMGLIGANPSSIHANGRAARKLIDDAREAVAALVGAVPEEVIFTSGGSEANNAVIMGAGRRRILVSPTEHAAVLKTVLTRAADSDLIPVDHNGLVDMEGLETLLAEAEEPALVCVMAANNETGVLQPMAEISELAHRHGALVHCDAVQAVGKIPVDIKSWGVDYLALSGHKIGGPQGIGALVRCSQSPLSSFITGGGQEHGLRAGTENVAAISGLGVAARVAADTLEEKAVRLKAYRDALEAGIKALSPATKIFCEQVPRLPNTSNFTLPGVRSDRQLTALDLASVSVSAGSACSAGKVEPSHVLDSMDIDPEISTTALRVSFGWSSQAADVDKFLEAWSDLVRHETAGLAAASSAA